MKLEEIENLILQPAPDLFEEYQDWAKLSDQVDALYKFAPKLLAVAKAAISARDSGYDPDGFCDTQDRIRAMRGLWEALQELERK